MLSLAIDLCLGMQVLFSVCQTEEGKGKVRSDITLQLILKKTEYLPKDTIIGRVYIVNNSNDDLMIKYRNDPRDTIILRVFDENGKRVVEKDEYYGLVFSPTHLDPKSSPPSFRVTKGTKADLGNVVFKYAFPEDKRSPGSYRLEAFFDAEKYGRFESKKIDLQIK